MRITIAHIVSDSSGKPRIRDSGVAVKVIADLHNMGWSVDQFVQHFELTPAEVYAALSYYYDHKIDMDAAIQAGQALVEAVPSIDDLKRRLAGHSA